MGTELAPVIFLPQACSPNRIHPDSRNTRPDRNSGLPKVPRATSLSASHAGGNGCSVAIRACFAALRLRGRNLNRMGKQFDFGLHSGSRLRTPCRQARCEQRCAGLA